MSEPKRPHYQDEGVDRRTADALRDDDQPGELRFGDRQLRRDGRVGDPRSPGELAHEYPPQRAREAGRTSGEIPREDPTGDDVTPETLIDEDGDGAAPLSDDSTPNDRTLREVSASAIGGGTGLDEAELADVAPVSKPSR